MNCFITACDYDPSTDTITVVLSALNFANDAMRPVATVKIAYPDDVSSNVTLTALDHAALLSLPVLNFAHLSALVVAALATATSSDDEIAMCPEITSPLRLIAA